MSTTKPSPFKVTVEPSSPAPGTTAPSAGASVTLKKDGSTVESLVVGDDGTVEIPAAHADSLLHIEITKDGFQGLTDLVTLDPSQPDIMYLLVKTADTEAAQPTAAPSIADTPSLSLPSDTGLDAYEFIYPNSVDGKYFQAAQARMYIGDLFIDELNIVQFQLMDNKIPIYGYRSRKFDAVGNGHSLVQGQIAINFVTEGYLYTVLKEFDRKMKSSLVELPDGIDAETAKNTKALVRLWSAATDTKQKQQYEASLRQMAAESPAKAVFINTVLKSDSRRQLTSYQTFDYKNACYLDIPFDIQLEFEGAGRTVPLKLETCFLGANDFVVAHDGKTLLDTYGFIARGLA